MSCRRSNTRNFVSILRLRCVFCSFRIAIGREFSIKINLFDTFGGSSIFMNESHKSTHEWRCIVRPTHSRNANKKPCISSAEIEIWILDIPRQMASIVHLIMHFVWWFVYFLAKLKPNVFAVSRLHDVLTSQICFCDILQFKYLRNKLQFADWLLIYFCERASTTNTCEQAAKMVPKLLHIYFHYFISSQLSPRSNPAFYFFQIRSIAFFTC